MPARPVGDITLRDEENQPGVTWTLRLRKTQAVGFHLANSMKTLLIQRYITGGPGFDPIPFPAIGGEEVELSEDLFEVVSTIWAMQEGVTSVPAMDDLNAGVSGGMSAEQLVALAAVAPNAWVQLLAGVPKIQTSGNASVVSAGASSGSASGTSETTQN